MENVISYIRSTDQFDYYLTKSGSIHTVARQTAIVRPQSLAKAIELSKEAK